MDDLEANTPVDTETVHVIANEADNEPEVTMEKKQKRNKKPCKKERSTKHKQKYRKQWEYQFKWLRSVEDNVYGATCVVCNVSLLADISVLKNHEKGRKHIKKFHNSVSDHAIFSDKSEPHGTKDTSSDLHVPRTSFSTKASVPDPYTIQLCSDGLAVGLLIKNDCKVYIFEITEPDNEKFNDCANALLRRFLYYCQLKEHLEYCKVVEAWINALYLSSLIFNFDDRLLPETLCSALWHDGYEVEIVRGSLEEVFIKVCETYSVRNNYIGSYKSDNTIANIFFTLTAMRIPQYTPATFDRYLDKWFKLIVPEGFQLMVSDRSNNLLTCEGFKYLSHLFSINFSLRRILHTWVDRSRHTLGSLSRLLDNIYKIAWCGYRMEHIVVIAQNVLRSYPEVLEYSSLKQEYKILDAVLKTIFKHRSNLAYVMICHELGSIKKCTPKKLPILVNLAIRISDVPLFYDCASLPALTEQNRKTVDVLFNKVKALQEEDMCKSEEEVYNTRVLSLKPNLQQLVQIANKFV